MIDRAIACLLLLWMRTTIALGCTMLTGCFAEADAKLETSAMPGSSSGPDETSTSSSSDASASATSTTATPSDESTETTGSSSDGGSSSESTGTTGEPVHCDADLPFSPPTVIAELASDANDDHAWLSADELTIYVSSNRDGGQGGYDVYVAVRDDITAPWGELLPFAGSAVEERGPALTANGLTMYVGMAGVGLLDYDIAVATRANELAEWSAFVPVAGINDPDAIDRAAWIDVDDALIYFETYRDGTLDLYRSERREGSVFAPPEPIGELNTAAEEGSPVLHDDGHVLYFASNRAGGVGDYDVWVAQRESLDDGFGEAVNVAEVSSAWIDWPTWISPDGCRLYIGSRRPDGGDYDLWLAERTP